MCSGSSAKKALVASSSMFAKSPPSPGETNAPSSSLSSLLERRRRRRSGSSRVRGSRVSAEKECVPGRLFYGLFCALAGKARNDDDFCGVDCKCNASKRCEMVGALGVPRTTEVFLAAVGVEPNEVHVERKIVVVMVDRPLNLRVRVRVGCVFVCTRVSGPPRTGKSKKKVSEPGRNARHHTERDRKKRRDAAGARTCSAPTCRVSRNFVVLLFRFGGLLAFA